MVLAALLRAGVGFWLSLAAAVLATLVAYGASLLVLQRFRGRMNARVLRAADYRAMRWKNGGGITTGSRANRPRARTSTGACPSPTSPRTATSVFPGVDRTLLLLEGGGVELELGAAEPVRLERRYARHAFAGEAPVSCRLLRRPTRDFNLMVRRGVVQGEVYARPIVGPMVFSPRPARSGWRTWCRAGSVWTMRHTWAR